jgi:CPA2 family monovalent cation:H+ antiporter-2
VPHDVSLVATVAVGLAFAFLGGLAAVRLRLPALLGYLLAGVAVGPFTPGFVADSAVVHELAEIGVILLMFGVGMHFSIGELLEVKGIALPGALVQIVVATALGVGLARTWGWSFGAGLVFGLALSVASTVVLLRALEDGGRLETPDGRIAIGWLLVEDLVMVLVLVLLPALSGALGGRAESAAAGSASLGATVGLTLGKIVLFVVFMLVVGKRIFPWVLARVERTGSRELFTLCVISLSLGVAFGSAELFGVSLALGAFFAGVVIHESDLSQRAATDLQPLQGAFGALFFVGVGMLFDPRILVRRPLAVLATLAIILVGKSLAALGIVLALRRTPPTALTISAALAQIGEFSFILAALGVKLKLLPEDGASLILAGALLSITVNPLLFRAASRLQAGPARVAAAAPQV